MTATQEAINHLTCSGVADGLRYAKWASMGLLAAAIKECPHHKSLCKGLTAELARRKKIILAGEGAALTGFITGSAAINYFRHMSLYGISQERAQQIISILWDTKKFGPGGKS